ncbi:MAG: NTP transferase domain-containing protein, partial [Gemmatimonadaceae bacterium]
GEGGEGGGERFLDTVVATATAAGASPVIVVVPPGVVVPGSARSVVNANATGEQIASVRLGLAQLLNTPVVGTLLWPVDHPVVGVESVLAVVDAFRRTGAPVTLPVFEGRRGHPSFFARETWRELMTVPEGEGGARAVVRAYTGRLVEVPVADAGVTTDIDTVADMPRDERRATDAVS